MGVINRVSCVSLQTLTNVLLNVPAAIAVLEGSDFILTHGNQALFEVWGKDSSIIGKALLEILPEIKDQPFPSLLKRVMDTNEAYEEKEGIAYVVKNGVREIVYFDYSYSPIPSDTGEGNIGVVVVANDVTDRVLTRKRIEEQESNFKNLIMQLPVGISILKGPNFIIDAVNDKKLQLWAKSRDVVGKKLADVFSEPGDQLFEILQKVFSTGEAFYGNQVQVEVPDNSRAKTLYINFVYYPIYEDQKITSIASIAYDVTDLVLAKKNAEERGSLLAYLNKAGEELALSLDTSSAIDKISKLVVPHFANWFSINVVNGENLDLLFVYNESRNYVQWAIDHRKRKPIKLDTPGIQSHIVKTGESSLVPLITPEIIRQSIEDPEQRDILLNMDLHSSIIVPMKVGTKVIGTINFIRTTSKKAYTELDLSFAQDFAARIAVSLENARLHEKATVEINQRIVAERKKDEFIGMASHELKTPLTSILGYLQILNRGVQCSVQKKFLEKTIYQTGKLTSLVNDMLDISKIAAAKLQFSFETVNLHELIAQCIEVTELSFPSHKIVFKSESTQSLVLADRHRIEQVILNLLSNAVKYSPNADKIEVQLSQAEGFVKIAVKDWGMGVPAKKLPHLFERFYRVNEADPGISGLGIGLYISKEIIEKHRGKIEVESEENKGTTFWVTLPK